MVVLKLALVALVLTLLAPCLVVPADAEPRMRCLTRDQQRTAIAERRAVPLAAVRTVGARPGARRDGARAALPGARPADLPADSASP